MDHICFNKNVLTVLRIRSWISGQLWMAQHHWDQWTNLLWPPHGKGWQHTPDAGELMSYVRCTGHQMSIGCASEAQSVDGKPVFLGEQPHCSSTFPWGEGQIPQNWKPWSSHCHFPRTCSDLAAPCPELATAFLPPWSPVMTYHQGRGQNLLGTNSGHSDQESSAILMI